MKLLALVALLFAGASALAPSRRAFLSKVAGAATGAAVAAPAFADTDYAGLPYLGGSEKIDINNANVRVYAKLPGMYPGAAGKIASNGPYKSVQINLFLLHKDAIRRSGCLLNS